MPVRGFAKRRRMLPTIPNKTTADADNFLTKMKIFPFYLISEEDWMCGSNQSWKKSTTIVSNIEHQMNVLLNKIKENTKTNCYILPKAALWWGSTLTQEGALSMGLSALPPSNLGNEFLKKIELA